MKHSMWTWTIIISAMILTVNGVTKHSTVVRQHAAKPQHRHIPVKSSQTIGNQRIIKIHGTSKVNQFNGHHKHVRSRPVSFPKGNGKDNFPGSKHHSSPPFFNGPSTNHVKHLARPPPHVYHQSASYGVAYPHHSFNTFRTSLVKQPSRTLNLGHVKQTTIKQTAQTSSATTQITPNSQVSKKTKTSSAGASHYSPMFTSFPHNSNHGHHIISSDGNNGPIKEVPAPDLGPKPIGVGLGVGVLLAAGPSSHPTPELFNNGFKSLEGGKIEAGVKLPSIEVGTLTKSPVLEPNLFAQGSFDGFSNNEPSVKDQAVETFNFEQESSVDVPNLYKVAIEPGKPGPNYKVTEQNHFASNDHILKSHDGTKYYYAPDPDPSLPVYKVPPTKDPYSTPSNGQSANIYIPQIPNTYAYIQGGGLGAPLGAAMTSEELYHLMQHFPAVISQISRPVVNFIGPAQHNGAVPNPQQSYYRQSSDASLSSHHPEIGDITQYLQNPAIHNLLHNTLESNHEQEPENHYSPSETYATQVEQNVYISKDQHQNNFQTSPYSYVEASSQSLGPQIFEISDGGQDYEPEASESRNNVLITRQTNESSGNSDKDSLPEDSDSNDLSFSVSEEKESADDEEPQIYHFKNYPEVPVYSSLPSEEAAKTLASLQAAGSVVNSYLHKIKTSAEDQHPNGDVEEADKSAEGAEGTTSSDNLLNTGFYQFSGFKKLDGDEDNMENVDADLTLVGEQVQSTQDDLSYLSNGRLVSSHQVLPIASSIDSVDKDFSHSSQEEESKKSVVEELEEGLFDETFGKKIKPK